jgi:DNA-binding NarL/FixJ family response regulator
MPRRLRVLVADPVKLMREVIIAAFADQPDIEIVGEVQEEGEILPRVRETRPDFVFISAGDSERRPTLCDTILRLHPHVNIIAVGARSNRIFCYWVSHDIHSSTMEASEEAILAAVRGKATLAGEV